MSISKRSVVAIGALIILAAAISGGCSRDRQAPEETSVAVTPLAAEERSSPTPPPSAPEATAPSPDLSPLGSPTRVPSPPRESTETSGQTDPPERQVYVPLIDQSSEAGEADQAEPAEEATPTQEATEPVDASSEEAAEPPPDPEEPGPEPMSLADWPAIPSLADWPRPANDNGFCIHNITQAYYHDENLDLQISRLKQMNMRWTLMLYGDENQLMKAAPRFRDAGIMVVWRKMLRPYESYWDWGRDIELLRELGMEPYMQIYNEPSLPAEWREGKVDQEEFLENFISAVQQIYNAGGYVGLQFVSDEWLRTALQEIKRRGGEKVFERMFLVPHPYGLNHPPDYVEDSNSVLSFLGQARVAEEEIGFVPPMIAGEGGWKWNATDDNRFPSIDATLHRDYHLALFNWFRAGVLSNGEALPDYLFAFCPWLLSSKLDDSAWFDSFAGDHTPTIEAVQAISDFQRRFSWDGG